MLDKNSFKLKALSDAEKFYKKVNMDQEQHKIFLDFISILLKNLPLPEIAAKGLGWRAVSIWQVKYERTLKDLMQAKPDDRIKSIEEISHYTLAMWEEEIGKSRIFTGEELSSLDMHLKSIWSEMLAALKVKDVDRAVSYYSHETRETYRELFASQKEILPKIAEDLSDIQLIKMNSPRDVEYDIRSVENGVTYSYMLIFINDIDGEWKILKY